MTKVDKKKKRDKPMGKTLFKLMRQEFKNRDKKYPPLDKIKKTKIKKGGLIHLIFFHLGKLFLRGLPFNYVNRASFISLFIFFF